MVGPLNWPMKQLPLSFLNDFLYCQRMAAFMIARLAFVRNIGYK